MARFPKVPGAGAKSINNPVYWSRMHLQNQRYASRSQAAIDKLNERWFRLVEIQNIMAKDFVDEVIEDLDGNDAGELLSLIDDMQFWNKDINEKIHLANNSHLSKYATCIKKVALLSIKLCMKYGAYSDIESVRYDAKEKMIYLNNDSLYYLG